MANFASIAAAARSVERLLNAGFDEEQPIAGKRTRAFLVRTSDFEPEALPTSLPPPALSIFPYWVNVNRTVRSGWSAVGSLDGVAHLALDLHFLISSWADNAEFELLILGRAMQCLESASILGGPLLHPSAGWAPNETVQIAIEDVSQDTLFRAFDSLPTDFRLSVAYVARVLRLDGRRAAPAVPVTTAATGLTPEPTP
jgi:hypothetical protein